MFSRPGRDESEDDLLRFQEEFLAKGSVPSAAVTRVSQDVGNIEKRPRDVVQLQGNENVEVSPNPPRKKSKFKEQFLKEKSVDAASLLDRHDTHVTVLLSKIIEKDTKNAPIVMPSATTKGFPTVLHRNTAHDSDTMPNVGPNKPKQSLFAQQFSKAEEMDFGISNQEQTTSYNTEVDEDLIGDDSCFDPMSIISGEGLGKKNIVNEVKKIHEENLKKISSMSQDEIMEEQKILREMLDPSILKFLQEKQGSQTKQTVLSAISSNDDIDEGIDQNYAEEMKCDISDEKSSRQQITSGNDGIVADILGSNVSENWLHMDQVEPEKLEWMKNCPQPNATRSGSSEQARFDFEGNIVGQGEQIPEYVGLHHHGDDPSKAGYSLEELFLLSRSNFLQQRVFAINTLGKIIEKDKQGIFCDKTQQAILPILIKAGLPFLLRWSLDNNTDILITASVACVAAMIVSKSDETVADYLCCGWYRGNELPLLSSLVENHVENQDEKSNNQSDFDVINQDLIMGLLQMKLVPRLRYILEVIQPSYPTVLNILDILIRIARHSLKAAQTIVNCPRLLDTILIQFLPNSWKMKDASVLTVNIYGHPLSKAFKLLRVLCSAGKYLADTMVTKYGVMNKILRFITVSADQMQLEITDAMELATESYRIWATCVSYGLGCEVFSDVYSHLLTELQSLSSHTMTLCQLRQNYVAALLGLIEAIVHVAGSKAELQAQMTTSFSNDDETTTVNMEASHLPPPPVDWSHVTGLLPVIGHVVQTLKDQFVNLDEQLSQLESFSTLSSIFNLLASFYQKLIKQPSYSPVECLDEVENFMVATICLPVMNCRAMEILLNKLSKYSFYLVDDMVKERTSSLDNLSDYGCIWYNTMQDIHPRCLQEGTPFSLLLSFMRLATVITACHKGVRQQFAFFVMHPKVIEYLKKNSTSARNNCESRCFFAKVEQHFQYFLVKLFYNILLQCGPIDGQITALYHTTSLLLFSRLGAGDEYYTHDLMSTVIFNPIFFYESKDECSTSLTSDMSEMGIDAELNEHMEIKKQKCLARSSLLSEAHKDLLSIRSTFMSSFAQMRHALARSRARSLHQPQNMTSFLVPVFDGSMLPVDWMFLPIVDLHNNAVKSELTTQPSNSPKIGSCSIVKRTLQWVLLLEEWRPVILQNVSLAARISRLMCTFLSSSDLFLDELIHNYLKTLFFSYTQACNMSWLDFNQPIPGITSFYDLYLSFLMQYEAVSYGDSLFSSFVLLPLQQRYNESFRKAIWSDHTTIFRAFSLPFDELPVAVEYFLVPCETNFEILTLQIRSLVTSSLRQSWSPVFYLIAIHHLCSFIFNKPDGKITEEQMMIIFRQKIQLLNQVLLIKDQELRHDIIAYHKPSRDTSKGFQVYTSLPPTRQLLLRKHETLEEAWEVWNQVK